MFIAFFWQVELKMSISVNKQKIRVGDSTIWPEVGSLVKGDFEGAKTWYLIIAEEPKRSYSSRFYRMYDLTKGSTI